MTQNIPEWGDDYLDSRDIIARIADLESERDAWIDAESPEVDEVTADAEDHWRARWAEEYPDEADELARWLRVAEQAEGYAADWQYGETLILDSAFEDYARDLAEDIGSISKDAEWPASFIDWPAAAAALQQDYTAVEVDGLTYWTR